MPSIDLRHFLGVLSRHGELLRVADEVDLRYEVCEFLRQADRARGPALSFERVKGHSMKVVGNLVGTKRRLALAFGLRSEDKLLETYRKRRGAGAKPRRVKDGPVKEVVLRSGKQVDLNALPIPIYHEEDAGPYISCGILTAKDPETGLRSMGLHRLQVKDSRHLGIHLANPPISRFVAKAEENNRPLDVAISLGVHPILLLASIVSSPTEDKVAIAGNLLGSPLALTKCETSDVDVPAHAEVVIEGKILPKVREPEGPFGETSGYYFSDQSHVIEVTAITHRKDPMLQALHPTSQEVALLCGPAGEAEIAQMLREKGFAVADLALSAPSGPNSRGRVVKEAPRLGPETIAAFFARRRAVHQARRRGRQRRQRSRCWRCRMGNCHPRSRRCGSRYHSQPASQKHRSVQKRWHVHRQGWRRRDRADSRTT